MPKNTKYARSATVSRIHSKSSHDFAFQDETKELSGASYKSQNGTVQPREHKSSKSPNSPRKLSKSTFYTDIELNDEKVYPASCVHTARVTDENQSTTNECNDELFVTSDRTKSLSAQDLTSLNITKKKSKAQRYATLKGTKSRIALRSIKLPTVKKNNVDDSSSDGSSEVSFTGSMKSLNMLDSLPRKNTFYESYDDLATPDRATMQITELSGDRCLKTASFYKGGVWRELGHQGGVIPIVGCDVSLHVSAKPEFIVENCSTCQSSSNIKLSKHHSFASNSNPYSNEKKPNVGKKFQQKMLLRTSSAKSHFSGPKLIDYNCPIISETVIDRRILLSLEDSINVNSLSKKLEIPHNKLQFFKQVGISFAIAGPGVRIDLKDCRNLANGAILQLPVNATLKNTRMLTNKNLNDHIDDTCVLTCLQSVQYNGAYRELTTCFLSGDYLQVSLDLRQIPPSKQAGRNTGSFHLVPVVKQHGKSLETLWDGIQSKTFHVGIYGPKHSYIHTTFCFSISSSGFNPPVIPMKSNNRLKSHLRLLNSYVIVVHKIRDFRLKVKTSSPFQLVSDLTDCLIARTELMTESRINCFFSLKYAETSKPAGKSRKTDISRKFTIELIGLDDDDKDDEDLVFKMKCEYPSFNSFEFPRGISPAIAKRLSSSMQSSPVIAVESKFFDTVFQWILGQLQDQSSFHDQTSIPLSKREVFGVRLANTIKSSFGKKKNPNLPSYFLQYPSDEYLPVLSRYSMLMDDINGNTKEWWICYYKHNVGLIRSSAANLLEFEEFSNWNEVRMSVGKLVEAITGPVLKLESESLDIETLLAGKIQNWKAFSTALCFGETFSSSSISICQSDKLRQEKISYFLQKYFNYRSSSGRSSQLHYDVLKALLYSEHFESAIELTTNLAFLNTALKIESADWLQLAKLLIGRSADDEYEKFSNQSVYAYTVEHWRPMYDYLCQWRERFGSNHKGALFALHQSLGHLPETSQHIHQMLTYLVILVRTFETLCKYDTNL